MVLDLEIQANVTAALKLAGMYQHSVMILISDNGGPLDHSNNFPYRGGKASLWEGGVRVEALVHSPLLPASRRGIKWSGLAHSSDWYVTLYEGIAGAGAGAATAGTGPRAPDGLNLWPALLGRNTTSPRTEVIHRVTNRYFNSSRGDKAGQVWICSCSCS
jgi:arylsulfatase A-like enzyme